MNSLKKLLPALVISGLVAVGCGTTKQQPTTTTETTPTTQERVDKKANELADLKGATVESVTL